LGPAWRGISSARIFTPLPYHEGKQTCRRQASFSQISRMRRERLVEDPTDGRRMSSVEIEDAPRDHPGWLREESKGAAGLAVLREEGDIRHLAHFRGGSHIGKRHFPVRSRRPFVCEQVYLIGLRRVLELLPSGQHREAAVDALRTMSAMGLMDGHVVHACAAPRITDQSAEPVRGDARNDVRLGDPCERIHHIEGTPEQN
jgi:hypothetical protein